MNFFTSHFYENNTDFLDIIETFEHKAKFPAALRPLTLQIGAVMLRKGTAVDDLVVDQLMEILPYNRFTLRVSLSSQLNVYLNIW